MPSPVGHALAGVTIALTAVAAAFVAVLAGYRALSGRFEWRLATMCGLAWGSHLFTDYVGVDRGHPAGQQLSDHGASSSSLPTR